MIAGPTAFDPHKAAQGLMAPCPNNASEKAGSYRAPQGLTLQRAASFAHNCTPSLANVTHSFAAEILLQREGPQKLALDVRRIVENRLDVLVASAGVSRNSNAGAITILDGVRETNAAGSLAMLSFQYEEMGRRVRGRGCHF